MDLIGALILGAVEGVTEFLPVSSTGHLVLTSNILGIPQTDFVKSFEIAIQGGAILAALVLFWRSFLNLEVLKRVSVAFIPTAIVGVALYKYFKEFLIGNESLVVWSLIIGGVFFIGFEIFNKNKKEKNIDIGKIPYSKCLAIGIFQSISIIPGVSRSGASIIGGLLMGLNRESVVKFSFLLAVPTLLAATAYDSIQSSAVVFENVELLIAGFVSSFVIALLAIKFLIGFVKKHNFVPFGVYRIVAGLVFLYLLIL